MSDPAEGHAVTVFLGGDVMPGRGVDQILPYPGEPTLRERYVDDARTYLALAERANGPVPRPVGFGWPWGDALAVIDAFAPQFRLINLESSITTSDEFAPGKGVHYRMNPANVGCLTVARPACALANNHVLDFGRPGLADTLDTLAGAGLGAAGAGPDASAASAPLIVDAERCRLVIYSIGTGSSGIPPGWAATADRSGVHLAEDGRVAAAMASLVRAGRRPGDITIVSVHWGSNWGYRVTRDQVRCAHALVEAGADIVHGHSSHHPRPIEVHHGRLILYGCGDLIDDYEGITGHERYRDDLRPLYFATVAPATGVLVDLRIVVMQARNLRLRHASADDTAWLGATLSRMCRSPGTRFDVEGDALVLRRA